MPRWGSAVEKGAMSGLSDCVRFLVRLNRAILVVAVVCSWVFAQQEYPDRRFPILFSEHKAGSIFGINVGPWFSEERDDVRIAWDYTWEAGLKWVKLSHWANKGCWDQVELMPGEYHFHDRIIGACIDDAIRHGMQVIFTLGFGNSLYGRHPEWEESVCVENPSHRDRGPCTRFYVPQDDAVFKSFSRGFARYCQEMVLHYGDRVKYWEIWTEPNWGDCERTDVSTWSPRPDPGQYAYLLFNAVNAIKAVDGEARVFFAGLVSMDKAFLSRCFELLNFMGELEGEPDWVCKNIDLIAIDPFRHEKSGSLSAQNRPESPSPVVNDETMPGSYCQRHLAEFESYEDQIADFREFLAPYFECRGDVGIWVLQDCWIYNIWGPVVQAKYLARDYIINFALGIPIFWWQLKEGSELYAHDWGILDYKTCEPRPAYYSLQAVCAAFDNSLKTMPLWSRFVSGDPGPTRLYSFSSPKDVIIALWKEGDATEETPETSPPERFDLEIESPYSGVPIPIWPVMMETYPNFAQARPGEHPCLERNLEYEYTAQFMTIILYGVIVADYPVVISLGRPPVMQRLLSSSSRGTVGRQFWTR